MTGVRLLKAAVCAGTVLGFCALVYQPAPETLADLPNRMPEAAPYIATEAAAVPPPYEEYWQGQDNPGQCASCHQRIFDEWNGSMMSNSWRDPVWRAAFLLLARVTSTHGECDTPEPPDGTPRARHNPFARPGECASEFDLGRRKYTLSRPGSLLDAFCSRCHMPANYLDNVPLRNVKRDPRTGLESAAADPRFNPTSDEGTGSAFATLERQHRNTAAGKIGIFCAVCHTFAATRNTPFHNYQRGGDDYTAGPGDRFEVPDPASRTLGYSIGAGSFRLSPRTIAVFEPFGPLAASQPPAAVDRNTSQVFGQDVMYQRIDPSKHRGYYRAMFARSEMCAACHDVTNPLPIRNQLGRWVGGFPIERTYTEWANSRYADRPGNRNFDPRYKRDCQSCHMQQDYGQPGTAQTLYAHGRPLPVAMDRPSNDGPQRPFFTHHFVGGNALVPQVIGKAVDRGGSAAPYPELSVFSFSSEDPKSPYSRALWTRLERRAEPAQQARLAWDRLRNVLSMTLEAPAAARPGTEACVRITLANTGSGHNFPTGFPEGRIAWLALHAYDLGAGEELAIHDSAWKRTSVGVGNLTQNEMVDPNFPGCGWRLPAGSPDPYAVQFKAVASLGDGCPTLDLPYAAPLNLITDRDGLPIDRSGRVIDSRSNPAGLAQFRDLNGNGDLFDDSFLLDTRFKPLPNREATKIIDRYSVVIPPQAKGPVAVTAAVYYQSVEAVVALKLLGNLTDTNGNFKLEPCVLGGLCDGRAPQAEPAVVEGSPPVPMTVRDLQIEIAGATAAAPAPANAVVYPADGADRVYRDAVVKIHFSRPAPDLTAETFTLEDSRRRPVAASVAQIGSGTWALFPNAIFLDAGEAYVARVRSRMSPQGGLAWRFRVARQGDPGHGDTGVPMGFRWETQRNAPIREERIR